MITNVGATDADETPPRAKNRGTYDVAVLQKALDILAALTDDPYLGLSELSEQTGASKASSFRVLSTLESRGFVTKDGVSRKYSPGPRLIALSAAVMSSIDLLRTARPTLDRLRAMFNETVNLAVLSGTEVMYLDILESSGSLRMAARPGQRDALHSTALGRALLSGMPGEARTLLGAYRRQRKTAKTKTSISALMAEISLVGSRGYAIDDEENEIGARCVAAPVFDAVGACAGAVSVSGPAARLTLENLDEIGRELVQATNRIGSDLGWLDRPSRVRSGPASVNAHRPSAR